MIISLTPVILTLALAGCGQRFCGGFPGRGGKGAQQPSRGPYGKDSLVRISLRKATSTRPLMDLAWKVWHKWCPLYWCSQRNIEAIRYYSSLPSKMWKLSTQCGRGSKQTQLMVKWSGGQGGWLCIVEPRCSPKQFGIPTCCSWIYSTQTHNPNSWWLKEAFVTRYVYTRKADRHARLAVAIA